MRTPKTSIKRPGSGRTKGSFSFVNITLGELNAKLADSSTIITVSRKWAEPLFPNAIAKPVQNIVSSIEGTTPETKVACKVVDFND